MKIIQRFREDENTKYDDIKDLDTYKVKDRGELTSIVKSSPVDADLNFLDVSGITDMSWLFGYSKSGNTKFNGDISQWDVSNVIVMNNMFQYSQFNGDISQWDVSNVTDMGGMFFYSKFNGDISKWDVSNVKNMFAMFDSSPFTGDISQWNVSNVRDMGCLFNNGSKFNGDISQWDVSNVTNMGRMFDGSHFTGDISDWDVSNVTDMGGMFAGSHFTGDISDWDVSNVESMYKMFAFSDFNGDISSWDVSNVKYMGEMFWNSKFNGDISSWDVKPNADIRLMFKDSAMDKLPGWYTDRMKSKKKKAKKSNYSGYQFDNLSSQLYKDIMRNDKMVKDLIKGIKQAVSNYKDGMDGEFNSDDFINDMISDGTLGGFITDYSSDGAMIAKRFMDRLSEVDPKFDYDDYEDDPDALEYATVLGSELTDDILENESDYVKSFI